MIMKPNYKPPNTSDRGLLTNLKLNTIGSIFSFSFAVLGLLGIISILIVNKNVSEVQQAWQTYQIDRSEKARLNSLLVQHWGYGGAIHHFKNYILRQNEYHFNNANNKLTKAQQIVSQYKNLQLTDMEQQALSHIQATIENYAVNLNIAKQQIALNHSAVQVDKRVKIDDTPAFAALDNLKLTQHDITEVKSKYQLLTHFRSALGYGGFIHHYKNAILRHDHNRLQLAHEKLETAQSLLTQYSTLELSTNEKQAITTIKQTLALYLKNCKTLQLLLNENLSPEKIDQRLHIDESSITTAFTTLNREIHLLTETRNQKVSQVLTFLILLVQDLAYIIFCITLVLMIFSIWIFRYRLLSPISNLIDKMKQLAADDFNFSLSSLEQTNELGEMARSIEKFKKNALEKQEADTKIKNILISAIDGIVSIDKNGIIISFNPAATKMFGYSEKEALGQNVKIIMPEPHKSKHDSYIRKNVAGSPARIMGQVVRQQAQKRSGEIFPVEISLSEMIVKEEKCFTAMIRDISERAKYEEKIRAMALTDPLTGLANRYQFEQILSKNIDDAFRTGCSIGIVLIDLDRFKPVNDTYGHHIGDLLLKEIANRLQEAKRATDTVARLGGDEFTIILNHLNEESIEIPIQRYQTILSRPYIIDGINIDIGASFGFSIFPQDDTNQEELLKIADKNMYQAKQQRTKKKV